MSPSAVTGGSGRFAKVRHSQVTRNVWAYAAAFFLLFAGAWSGTGATADGDQLRRAAVSAPTRAFPPTEVTATDVLRAVQAAHGTVVLVNVWATWCDPCRHEFPALLRVEREFAGRGFRLILVSADFADQRPKVQEFLAQQGVGFPTFLKAEDDMGFINALDPRWSGALPASFLYGRNGKLRDFWEGETSYDVLAGKVNDLLGGEAGSSPYEGSR